MIPLGPFDLLETLGQGGMATVWRGVHRDTREPAAIKVLTGDRARDPRALAVFRREVRAVATLEHPAIVTVFDLGTVTPAAAEADPDGLLVPDSPFLAMELASPDTVRHIEHLDWPALHHVLLQILDALAHAHARGVVHRDLKPDNVLLADDPDHPLAVKLSDFGIAHILDHRASPDARGKTAGTPAYMAPEQLRGRWRDYGPWTDLYALGCMTFELCCGKRPFGGTTRQIVDAHLEQPPPTLEPRFPVPDALEPWIHTLLEKSPARRFRRAADAARELPGAGPRARPRPPLSPAVTSPPFGGGAEPPLHAEDASGVTTLADHSTRADVESLPPPGSAGGTNTLDRYLVSGTSGIASLVTSPPESARDEPDAMPTSWRRTDVRPSMRLVGAGLGLYGLRPVPMVGREAERDAIWDALGRTAARGRAEVVLVRGAGGTGRRRVLRWMAERAHELGVATVLETTLDETGADGLGRLLADNLHCAGLTRADIYERLETVFADHGARAARPHLLGLTEVMRAFSADPERRDTPPAVRFDAPAVRHAVVRQLLRALSRRRPALVVVAEAQRDVDVVDFAHDLLEWQARLPTPVLLALTVDERTLATPACAAAARRLAELERRPGVTTLRLGPLGADEHRELVEKLLRLEPGLAAQVARRTEGHPLFAVQLVGDWVQRGVLEAGTRGFVLRAGEQAEVPDGIHELWMQRLDEVARALGADASTIVEALELAVVLGERIDTATWLRLCGAAGVSPPAALVDTLVVQGLAELVEARADHWHLHHQLLRESLERTARESGRWARHQQLAARQLRADFDAERPDSLERLEHHLRAAGRFEQSEDVALKLARVCLAHGERDRARVALDRQEDALMALDVSMGDVRWRDSWLLRAELELRAGQPELAEQALAQVEVHNHQRDPHIAAHLQRLRGWLAETEGAVREAAARYQEAIQGYHALGDEAGLARSLERLARLRVRGGQLEQGAMYFEASMEMFERTGNLAGMASALRGVARVCADSGDLTRAAELFERAASYSDHAEDRPGRARAALALARVARQQGDLDRATRELEDAQARLEQLGARRELVAFHLVAAEIAAARDRWPEVTVALEQLAEALPPGPMSPSLVRSLTQLAGFADDVGESGVSARIRALVGAV